MLFLVGECHEVGQPSVTLGGILGEGLGWIDLDDQFWTLNSFLNERPLSCEEDY
jgi:hypothetical protein